MCSVSFTVLFLLKGNSSLAQVPEALKFVKLVAGTGEYGHTGDGGPATQATFMYARSAIGTKNGDVYIVDNASNVIRKVNSSGIITTVAGTPGVSGYSGDGGPATDAKLNGPSGIYYDEHSGSLYVTETYNNCVRMIDANGVISTFAGDGSAGYSGDGDLATKAQLTAPSDVAGNRNGEIIIADTFNRCVRKVGTDKRISTIAGTGVSGAHIEGALATESPLYNTMTIAVNDAGELFLRTSTDNFVLKVSLDGRIRRFAGSGVFDYSGDGGPALDASFKNPSSLACGKNGELYIVDLQNYRVRMVTPSGIIWTVAGSGEQGDSGDDGPALEASFTSLHGVSVAPNGDIYLPQELKVRKIYAAATCFGLPANDAGVCSGHGVCVSTDNCTCDAGYTGERCSDLIVNCFDIPSTDPMVCSGHGVCSSTDTCTCHTGYTGEQCSDTTNPNGAGGLVVSNQVLSALSLAMVFVVLTQLFMV